MSCSQHVYNMFTTIYQMFTTCSWHVHVHDTFIKCLCHVHVHDTFMIFSCQRHVHDMFKTCSWHVHDNIFMTFSQHVQDMFTTCSRHMLTTCSWHVQHMFTTCSQHFFDMFTCPFNESGNPPLPQPPPIPYNAMFLLVTTPKTPPPHLLLARSLKIHFRSSLIWSHEITSFINA